MLALLTVQETEVCSLFSFDPETCVTHFGCGFCLENKRCIPLIPKTGPPDECVSSGMIVRSINESSGNCFSLYSDDGCISCVSSAGNSKCGWCQSLGICVERDAALYGLVCPGDDLLETARKCQRSSCTSKLKKSQCHDPCVWSDRRNVCVLPRIGEPDTAAEHAQKREVWVVQRIFVLSLVGLITVAFFAIIAVVWMYSEPLYEQVPVLMSSHKHSNIPSLFTPFRRVPD